MHALDEKDVNTSSISSLFLRTFVPLALIVLLVAGLLIRMLYENELSLIKLNEETLLQRSTISLQKSLQPPQDHLLSLRQEQPVLDGLMNPDSNLEGMEASFASMLSRNPNYFQIRWIDELGQERLRMEPDPDSAKGYLRVPTEDLQNKIGRYYFQGTLALGKGEQLYLSPMDLNVEFGVIEQPLRPTLRMAIPLYIENENHGLIIVNIDARQYLSDLQQILENDAKRIQLINPEGYWLQHQDNNLEWGFQLSHGKAFKKQHPDIWQQMHSYNHSQLLKNSGLWSWETLYPDDDPKTFNNQTLGFLLLHQPVSVLNALRLQYWGGGLLLTLILLIIGGFALYRLLQAQQAQRQAERNALENRIHAEQLRKQREDEQRFRVIFNASHTPLLVCDSRGNISLVNPALEKLFGYSAFELTGLPVEHLIPVELRKGHVKERTDYLNHLRPRRKMMKNGQSLQGMRKDGELINVEIGLSPYEVDGEISILATLEDITSRLESERQLNELHTRQTRHLERAREDAERLARLKSDFLANMSHEIRTPLNAIMVLGELLNQEELPENAQTLSKNIQHAGDNLLHIVNDVLDFSKIEAGGLSIEHTPFSLKEIYAQILSICEVQAQQKGLKLHLNTGGTERLFLLGDPYRLKQILLNLISNAIKFTQEGRVNVHIQPQMLGKLEATLKFSVSDTGPGISPEQQEVIFDAFAQADSSVTREFGGTGLGLAISRKLIQLMGSELNLSSQLGQGSTFSFILSLPLAEASQVETADPQAIKETSLEGKTLLVVDDSDLNRDIAQRIILRAGGKVILAENGAEALAKTGELTSPPDLILMDLQMPVMDGYEATRQIRQLPNYDQVPVIALTAGITESAHDEALKCGADQVLTKPFTISQIMACLQDHLPMQNPQPASKPASESPSTSEPATESERAGEANDRGEASELPLLDEATAIFNWGDKESLQHFMKQFESQYGKSCKEIEQLLDAGERDKAEGLAHKVKGAAGSLYLCALQAEFSGLEQQLREGKEQIETIKKQNLPSVSATLSRTLDLIANYT
ncbi:PAS domain-containing hybrid sensor histidine kinase/response regulator [Oceanospirillum sanctuarii]|uniref:PAS domain-containing hybrid sensor histidine kinase/response regulator n=1 Tax=Oceanospirillum sanctuarii TaxID=1434821 RepID=UPI000A378D6A|nr:ATP-binding protein [Oceanospirillum sanctuarii]